MNYPFQRIHIDFAELLPFQGYQYMLVIIEQLSNWSEGTPSEKANMASVVKFLLKEIIPRFRLPIQIDSDRGSHFTS